MTDATRSRLGWIILRLTLAGLIAAHGWTRLILGGAEPFGAWLTAQGVPAGPVIAWGITGLEILGTPLLALGRLVLPLTLAYSAIYAVGIVMVHAKAGWFVVGAGRNGAEYSVLLIVALLCVGAQHARSRVGAR
ncbi:MAG: DoxX family protein [Burkholderiales bacterium]|nr:DoxX family protein [Betaproteobacteria bacterium]MBP8296159.1 DoxX family protein [Burkholderiales bacterium]